MIRSLTALALGACSMLLASSASAQTSAAPAPAADAGPAHPISAALLVGYGLNNSAPSGADTMNAYGLGFGARAGYTLPMNVYVGGTFIYHLGYSKDVGANSSVSGRVNPLGVEAGYDLKLAPNFTIRPFVGLGLALYSASVTIAGQSADGGGSKFAIWPGVAAMYDVNDQLFVGADVRYTIVTGVDSAPGAGSPNAPGAYANLGYRF